MVNDSINISSFIQTGMRSDLTVLVDNIILNVRAAILIETPSGFIFEKSKDDFLFVTGGRIHVNPQKKLQSESFLKN